MYECLRFAFYSQGENDVGFGFLFCRLDGWMRHILSFAAGDCLLEFGCLSGLFVFWGAERSTFFLLDNVQCLHFQSVSSVMYALSIYTRTSWVESGWGCDSYTVVRPMATRYCD